MLTKQEFEKPSSIEKTLEDFSAQYPQFELEDGKIIEVEKELDKIPQEEHKYRLYLFKR